MCCQCLRSGDSEGSILLMLHLRDADTSRLSASYLSSLPRESAVPAFVPALVRSDNGFAVESFAPIGGDSRQDSRDCTVVPHHSQGSSLRLLVSDGFFWKTIVLCAMHCDGESGRATFKAAPDLLLKWSRVLAVLRFCQTAIFSAEWSAICTASASQSA